MRYESGLDVTREGAVVTVTFDRPEVLNAQTPAMWRDMAEIGRELTGDLRVAVLRGAGRAFSAGLDRSVVAGGSDDAPSFMEMAAMAEPECDALIATYQQAFSWLRRPDLLSIAVVHGHAIGAGFQAALACDFRLVTSAASFCMAETTLGLIPDLGGTRPLVTAVGYSRAMELCAFARRLTGEEALSWGLANAIAGETELEDLVATWVKACQSTPRAAVTELKALLQPAIERSQGEQEAWERSAQIRRIRDLAGLGD